MTTLNLERIYQYRFNGVDGRRRDIVWSEISSFILRLMGEPDRLLDPAGGRGEFINSASTTERWFIDMVEPPPGQVEPGVRVLTGDARRMELPRDYFDGIFVSNFLEHLPTQEAVGEFLTRMFACQASGGRVAVMGPNFRYCGKQYFDCADHCVALTHVSVAEHIYAAGYEVDRVIPRFLPFSFRGLLPPSRRLTRLYLRVPPAWKVLGKQFLVIGRKAS